MRTILLAMSILFLSANLRAEKTTISFETNAICGMCIDRIEDACYALQGVKNVDVDLGDKTVSVTFNDAKTSEEAIKMAVADAGYMAGNFAPNPIVQESLPGCCGGKQGEKAGCSASEGKQ
ncbi:MAG: heavy-metal-associated domain-containing protein [Bacteroidota bacterium]|nr:heavy-metal-associated domain-containing protein [Bacteroidota bacterium]MEC8628432.1 heavy-metal-associated domain-containing protein [Bacteroidota bacterium]